MSIADIKRRILAASQPPRGTSSLFGEQVVIRGLTSGEEFQWIKNGLAAHVPEICAACIVNEKGDPLFTVDQITAMSAGVLRPVFTDILTLSFPKATEKN